MASTSTKQMTVTGSADTEAEARQKAIANALAYIDTDHEELKEVSNSWNEGRGIYTLVYTVSVIENKEQKKDEDQKEKQKEEAKDSTGGNKNSSGESTTPVKKLVGSYNNNTKELRSSPGYTNYVVSTGKNINGTIASSSVFKRYYSDISAEAYINGEWFEDINKIKWTVNQHTMFLFGYNSYIYDDISHGTRIITGEFTINFTEPNIINKAINQGTRTNSIGNGTTFEEYSIQSHKNKVSIDGSEVAYEVNPVHNAIWKPRFDIDIVFGEKENLGGQSIMPKHIILWDCSITGSEIEIGANEGTLQEKYAFMARDFKIIS